MMLASAGGPQPRAATGPQRSGSPARCSDLRPWRQLGPWRRRAARPLPACRCAAPERQPELVADLRASGAQQQRQQQQRSEHLRKEHAEREQHAVNGHRVPAGGLLGGSSAAGSGAPTPPLPGTSIRPDLELPAPPGGSSILVFGCVHADSDSPHLAQFIMERQPDAVVVETAADAAHGSATGNILRRAEALRISSDPRTRGWAQLGAQLEDCAGYSPAASPLWGDLSTGRHRLWSEHLVYVAAFAVNADLVFGDRPKRVTYHRLLWCPSVEELDAAYGVQSALNYHELVSTLRPFNDVANTNCVHRVMILERDATLLHTLHAASLRAGPGGCVVGVVGASHLAGMRHLWESGRWAAMADSVTRMPDVAAVQAAESPERLAVRWALFRAVLRLTCRPDVIRDVRAVVGPVPPALKATYCLAAELYGSSRMLLAVLNRDQLAEVCQGWRCDFYKVLAPLRAVRPINGGPGFDEELVLALRTLQFELAGPAPRAGDPLA